MAPNQISTLSIIWEECIDKEICINIPIIGKKCARISGCIRLINEGGTISIEVEAFGRRWRYALTNACHDVITVGIAKLRLCIEAIPGGVRIVLEGCLSVAGLGKCFTLGAYEVRYFKLSDVKDQAELLFLGLDSDTLGRNIDRAVEFGAYASTLGEAEIKKIILQ